MLSIVRALRCVNSWEYLGYTGNENYPNEERPPPWTGVERAAPLSTQNGGGSVLDPLGGPVQVRLQPAGRPRAPMVRDDAPYFAYKDLPT